MARTKAQKRQLDLVRDSIFHNQRRIEAEIERLTRELDELAEADQALLGVL
ncbi:DUF1003 domain-containing protein [Curtobacterium sp. 'Ferrero']|uniref:DUF1003 domain-containing protein n=1 Tax=Curtobacterium sp. 'Ferrero' TaxID=2033654 RepID=UPI001142C106|nr:DUF1003 domain-containing protein [Curtobacterium sp. 'Ferrero']